MKRYIKATVADLSNEPLYVKMELVRDPDTSSDILAELANSTSTNDERVRAEITLHPNITPAIVERLSNDPVMEVRRAVALNANIPEHILLKLAHDRERDVRLALLHNSHLRPMAVLESLVTDDDESIRRRVAEQIDDEDILDLMADDEDADIRYAITQNPSITSTILHKLISDSDRFVRREVARNINTSADDLISLSRDRDLRVRIAVADNPNTPEDVVRKIREDLY
jgi:hypothetical protein